MDSQKNLYVTRQATKSPAGLGPGRIGDQDSEVLKSCSTCTVQPHPGPPSYGAIEVASAQLVELEASDPSVQGCLQRPTSRPRFLELTEKDFAWHLDETNRGGGKLMRQSGSGDGKRSVATLPLTSR